MVDSHAELSDSQKQRLCPMTSTTSLPASEAPSYLPPRLVCAKLPRTAAFSLKSWVLLTPVMLWNQLSPPPSRAVMVDLLCITKDRGNRKGFFRAHGHHMWVGITREAGVTDTNPSGLKDRRLPSPQTTEIAPSSPDTLDLEEDF